MHSPWIWIAAAVGVGAATATAYVVIRRPPAPVAVEPAPTPAGAPPAATPVVDTQRELPLVTREAPPCMRALVCPAGTTVRHAWSGEQCTSANGVAEGPGHRRTQELVYQRTIPPGFECWEMKNNQRVGTAIEYWHNGHPKYERTYRDGAAHGPQRDYSEEGQLLVVYDEDGEGAAYFPNGAKKYAGTYRAARRDGTWTRWYEDGKKRFECGLHGGLLDGECRGWDASGKLVATGVFAKGSIVSGQQVRPFFADNETAIAGRRPAPTDAITVERLLEACDAYADQTLRVTGTVLETYVCPSCPAGAMCKPCMGDHFVLGGAGTARVAVMSRPADHPRVGTRAVVTAVASYGGGRGVYAGSLCMLRSISAP